MTVSAAKLAPPDLSVAAVEVDASFTFPPLALKVAVLLKFPPTWVTPVAAVNEAVPLTDSEVPIVMVPPAPTKMPLDIVQPFVTVRPEKLLVTVFA